MKVREAILAKQERAFSAESKEVGVALWNLGNAYSDLGDHVKQRDVLERALPIYAACYEGHIEIARLLLDSGAAADLDRENGDGDTGSTKSPRSSTSVHKRLTISR